MKLTRNLPTIAATFATALTLTNAYAQNRTTHTPNRNAPITRPSTYVGVTPAATATPVMTPAAPTPVPFTDVHPYQSQSIIRLADGTVLTFPAVVTDYKIFTPGKVEPVLYPKTALLYDKRNPLPEIQAMGGNYAFFKGNYFATVSADGLFNYKGKAVFEPSTLGGSYFTKKGTEEIVVIDSYGYFVETGVNGSQIRLVGGNFFIEQDGTLSTIKSIGVAPGNNLGLITRKVGNFSDAVLAGGNYFVKQDGTLVTINSNNGFYSNPYTLASRPALLGGNYFIGEDNAVYTVSSEGDFFKTITLTQRPTQLGYSYMTFADGTFALVTANGGLHTEAVRVAPAGKAEYSTKLPALEGNSVYTPNNNRKN